MPNTPICFIFHPFPNREGGHKFVCVCVISSNSPPSFWESNLEGKKKKFFFGNFNFLKGELKMVYPQAKHWLERKPSDFGIDGFLY